MIIGDKVGGNYYDIAQLTITDRPPEEARGIESLETAYLNWVLEKTSYLSLEGIDPKSASDVQMRLSLGAVYTALMTLTTLQMFDREEGPRRLSALELLDRVPRLVLLGDPGAARAPSSALWRFAWPGKALGRRGRQPGAADHPTAAGRGG